MNQITRLVTAAVLLCLVGCKTSTPPYDLAMVPEVRPGLPSGYLAVAELPNSFNLLPPPPAPASAAMRADEAAAEVMLTMQGTDRFEMAERDAVLSFPEATHAFQCILGAPISAEETPRLNMLMRRTLMDAGLSTYAAKNHYKRNRPFMVNAAPTCAPETEDRLRQDGSYPSGHSAIGFAWGLVLAQLDSEHADVLVKRGWDFAQSRAVCNVHWLSDVDGGRLMGSIVVSRLQTNAEFREDFALAKAELASVKSRGLLPEGCL